MYKIYFFFVIFSLFACGGSKLGVGFDKEVPKTEPQKVEELTLSKKNLPLVSTGTAVFTDSVEIVLTWGFDRITIKPKTKCEAIFDEKRNVLKVSFGGDALMGIPQDATLLFFPEEGEDENFVFKGWPDHPGETAYQSSTSSETVKKFWKIEKGEGTTLKFTPQRKIVVLPGKTGGLKK